MSTFTQSIKVYPVPEEITYTRNENYLQIGVPDEHEVDHEGLVLSKDWQVFVNNQHSPVYATTVTRGGPHSFTSFEHVDQSKEIEITAIFRENIESIKISPEHLGIEGCIEGERVKFSTNKVCHLVLEVNGKNDQPLTISIDPPENEVPDKNDPNVLWFASGLHMVDSYDLGAYQTLYLEAGAVLKAKRPTQDEKPILVNDWANKDNYADFIRSNNTQGIKVSGRGIIDTSALDWHERFTLFFNKCEDVLIEGVTFVGACHWTLKILQSRNVRIQNVKLYGHRENSDGIDIVSSSDVYVSDCFIRTGDDAIVVKAMLSPPVVGGENILVEKCVVWNDKVRCFGITGETMSDIKNVIFRNCDIIHSYADWIDEVGSLAIVICDSGLVKNILFENIRIQHEVHYSMLCLITRDFWSSDDEAGFIENITFRNIHINSEIKMLFKGYDREHKVKNILLEDIYYNDNKIMDDKELHIETNEFIGPILLKSNRCISQLILE